MSEPAVPLAERAHPSADPPAGASKLSGAEWIAEYLAGAGLDRVFVLTGGACAFMIDAVARHPKLDYTCFQHEQSAAMAADAVWRVSGKVGVTMATSGPGATNLITGIACSYFDSIPSLHITGQVNQRESSAVHGANVRQSGFQETDIVSMVRPITKYAVMVRSVEELQAELPKALAIALEGRMGPVLIDVPMDVQQAAAQAVFPAVAHEVGPEPEASLIGGALAAAKRPIVLWGAGIGLAGAEGAVMAWLRESGLPFVSTWAGLTYFDNETPNFLGQIGVYGNRGANFALQNADLVLVLGSRLDNRQRSGNAQAFATGARVIVVDVDGEELKKYGESRYTAVHMDLANFGSLARGLPAPAMSSEWLDYTHDMVRRYKGKEMSTSARKLNTLSPYEVVRRINGVLDDDAIVIADTGATVCWVFQAFKVRRHRLFTAGGNSPMGYALPAAIGAKLECPRRQVVSINGDGGFQVNLQELQTVAHYKLDIPIVVMNNGSYGIIKQFQDSYLGSRYDASFKGYGTPDFGRIAAAFGLGYRRVEALEQIDAELFRQGACIVDVALSEHTLIEPKLEMGRPINDQFPYLPTAEYAQGNRFVDYPRPPAVLQALSADDVESA